MELVTGGDLHSYLKRKADVSWLFKMRVLIDIARGMAYLHTLDPPIVHCDLRRYLLGLAGNIVVILLTGRLSSQSKYHVGIRG